MDKRRTQRTLGILVIIALVIILFPLLFSKNEVTTQTAAVATPAFPNQQKAPATAAINNEAPPSVPNNNDSTAVSMSTNDIIPASSDANAVTPSEPVSPLSNANSAMNSEPAEQQAPAIQEPTQTAVTPDMTPATSEENTEVKTLDQANNQDLQKAPERVSSNNEETEAAVVEKPVKKPQPVKTSKIKKPKVTHDVAKLNKPAWVVQMGSFKNKDNARSLTDKLRAAGYNAFTKDIKSAKGNMRTRVYVGPEFKEAEATKVSQKIQRDLNLPSIVLPYKPLAL